MPQFTVEVTYDLPTYRQKTYEASSGAEACRKALADDDWDHAQSDYDSCGPNYITGVWPGDKAHEGGMCEIPSDLPTGSDDARPSPREYNTILAALRYWRREGLMSAGSELDIAAEHGCALTSDEIDALCQRLSNSPNAPILCAKRAG